MGFFNKKIKSFSPGSFLTRPQEGILSAATLIMVMIAASRVLGLVRNRVLAHFFAADQLSIYFAAFRLPEVIFEVLVFGALSAAFVPTITRYISRGEKDEAWYVASVSMNIAVLIFLVFASIVFIFPRTIYRVIAPGFDEDAVRQIANITRILLLTQGFFVVSYFLTAILESMKRFLVPAIAPLFYNLGIIFGTLVFSRRLGVYGPAIGAVIGAALHFIIQVPFALHFGFRFRRKVNFKHPGVRQIGKLALPRIVELSFLEIGKVAELFFASMVTISAYTYYTFANSLQLLPIGLFGSSIAKASLPTLSYEAGEGKEKFRQTILNCFGEINFLVIPCAVFLAILRIPAVRLVFGARQFSWEATVQTGQTLSAFALGIFSQASNYLLTRAFYALHDTKTPVVISIINICLTMVLGWLFISLMHLPIWSLALAFSLSSIIQFFLLMIFLDRKLGDGVARHMINSLSKISGASVVAGFSMFFLLKILDQSVWSKQSSFLKNFGLILPTDFERFVFDTHYVSNVLLLTAIVGVIGFGIYLLICKIIGIREVSVLINFLRKLKRPSLAGKQQETMSVE